MKGLYLELSFIRLDAVDEDPLVNAANVCRMVKEQDTLPDVIVLPELWTGGYTPCSQGSFHERCMDAAAVICSLCEELGIHAVVGSMPWRTNSGFVSRAWIINDLGERFAYYDKTHLSSAEKKDNLFVRGEQPLFFSIGGVLCSVIIGYDLFFPEFMRCIALGGAKVIFVLLGREVHKEKDVILRAAAVTGQIFVVACDSFGGSLVISPSGELISRTCPENDLVFACINPANVDKCRQSESFCKDRRPELYALLSSN